MSERIRVLIVDDQPLMRLGLGVLLQAQLDMQVVGHAANGEAAVLQAQRTQPDVIILDMHMPGIDGLAALSEIKQMLPEARCIMLSDLADAEQVVQAVKAGAEGFLLKDVDPDDLLDAIRAVYMGQDALSPAATRQLMDAYQTYPVAPGQDGTLTPAEFRVLRLLAQGLSNGEIGSALGVSARTVSSHVQHILDKLGVHNRVEAALYARDHGLTA
jgi:DNA-binding NarL/FixJ family response regulator